MLKSTITVLLLFFMFTASSQQLHFTTQYIQHNSMINPGAAGIANKDMIGLSYRNMWSSFPGNPTTYMIYGDFNIPKMNSGVGAYLYRDQTGPTSRTGLQLAFSKHILGQYGRDKFGLGIEIRGLQYAIDKSKLSASLEDDPVLAGAENKFAFDAGAGAYYTNGKISLGAAASQLIESKIDFGNPTGTDIRGKLYRHYTFTANYKIQTGDDIYIIPNGMVRLVEHAPAEYELGALMNYKEKIWWGLGWRFNQFWTLQAGVKILQRMGLTYSYDIYQTPIDVFTAGSGAHEIGLRFDLKKGSPQF